MFRGFLSTWAGLVINGVIAFLLTRVLLHGLGDFYYSLWILASTVLDYYGLLDMGMRYSMQRFVARYGGANQRQALDETFMTGMAMIACIGGVVLLVCAVLLVFLPGFFHLSDQAKTLFRVLLIIQSVTLALDFPARIMGAYLCGLHRFDLYNASGIVWGVSRGLAFWLVIRMGGKVTAIALAQLGVVSFIFLLDSYFVRRADPGLSIGRRYTSWKRTKELVQFSFFVFVSDIGDRLRFYTDVIVISRVLTVALAAPFNVITRLMEVFKMAFFPITGPLNTEANRVDSQGKYDEVKRLFLRSTKVCVLLAFAGTAVLVLHGRDILRFWIDEAFTSNYSLLLVLTIGYCVILMQSPSNVFLYVRSRHKALAAWTLAEGIANLFLSIYWARQFGIVGVALGTTVPMLIVRLGIQPFYTLNVLDIGWGEYLAKSFLRPTLVTAGAVGLGYLFGLLDRPSNLLAFAGMLAGLAGLFAALSYWIVADGQEREALRHHGERLLARVRTQHA